VRPDSRWNATGGLFFSRILGDWHYFATFLTSRLRYAGNATKPTPRERSHSVFRMLLRCSRTKGRVSSTSRLSVWVERRRIRSSRSTRSRCSSRRSRSRFRPRLHPTSDYREAKSVSGAPYDQSFAAARLVGWPRYPDAPQLATASLGKRLWTSLSAPAVKTAVKILDGKDPGSYQRYLTYLRTLPPRRQLNDIRGRTPDRAPISAACAPARRSAQAVDARPSMASGHG
jgi:hypothetical protein